MSLTVSSHSNHDDQDVSAGVSRLEALARKMKAAPEEFGQADVLFVQELVAYMQSLHEEVRRLRETFETETINASALRYHLHFLPLQIQQELKESVRAARESNASRLEQLEHSLRQIEGNMARMKDTLADVEGQNSHLHPARDRVAGTHAEIVSHLNQTMQEKSAKQILLNDTRDQLREAHQTIADIEDDIGWLGEELGRERAETKREKRRVKQQVDETRGRHRDQERENAQTKAVLDEATALLEERRERLQIKARSTAIIEKSWTDLRTREALLEQDLGRMRETNGRLRQETVAIDREHLALQLTHGQQKDALESKLREMQEAMEAAVAENERLKATNKQLHAHVKLSDAEKGEDAQSIKSLKADFMEQQRAMSELSEQTSRLLQENDQFAQEIHAMTEAHEAAMKVKTQEAEELKSKLVDQQTARKELQEELVRTAERAKAEHARTAGALNRAVVENKQAHTLLTKEGQQLQRTLKQAEADIKASQARLKASKEAFQAMREKLEKDAKAYEASIEKYTRSRGEKQAKLDHDTPIYLQLQTDHRAASETHDARRLQLGGLKRQRDELLMAVRAVKQHLDKLDTPKKQAEDGIQDMNRTTVQILQHQGRQKRALETSIVQLGEKLVAVVDQNERFKHHCREIEEYNDELNGEIIDSGALVKKLRNRAIDIKQSILDAWLENIDETRLNNQSDQVTLDGLSETEELTRGRHEHLDHVVGQLQAQIQAMSAFLSAAAKFRGQEDEDEPEPRTEPGEDDEEAEGESEEEQPQPADEEEAALTQSHSGGGGGPEAEGTAAGVGVERRFLVAAMSEGLVEDVLDTVLAHTLDAALDGPGTDTEVGQGQEAGDDGDPPRAADESRCEQPDVDYSPPQQPVDYSPPAYNSQSERDQTVDDSASEREQPAYDSPPAADSQNKRDQSVVDDSVSEREQPVDDSPSERDQPVDDSPPEGEQPADDSPSERDQPADDSPPEGEQPVDDSPSERVERSQSLSGAEAQTTFLTQ